jgi:hypothetical protein
MWAQDVVFGWCERGGLRGKRGELTRTFVVAKMRQVFQLYFLKPSSRLGGLPGSLFQGFRNYWEFGRFPGG